MLFPVRENVDPWIILFSVMALVVALWASRKMASVGGRQVEGPEHLWELPAAGALGAGLSALLVGAIQPVIAPLAAFLAITVLIRASAWRLNIPGAAWLAVEFGAVTVGWFWTSLLIDEAQLPGPLEPAALVGVTILLVIAILGRVERIAREAILTHEKWQLPVEAPLRRQTGRSFKVSVHLPCYAEPPEVVKETMNRLAALDYDNYEVLVCDNNTRDEALWRPLEAHCAVLNARLGEERFRFFHVAPLEGAKAGALNFCLEVMAPDTDIVAVIDADYFSRPDFLARLAPFFEDPRVGYVQTPHDYRDYAGNPYLTGCYWEYMPNNKVDMPGVSEYGGAFTIGTMCLLRAPVLRAVGGWAEWCLTEDSEVSVRLRAAGYRGIYLRETFGRGLIPDSFDDYKKQRFRWTAGPVQQLRRHWKLFLPAPWARRMPGWTKLLEVLRCIAPIQSLIGVVFGLLVLGGIAIATLTGGMQPLDLPGASWAIIPLGIAVLLVRTHHRYRLSGCTSIADMARGEIARASLSYIVLVSGVAGLSSKPLAWRRTPKFGAHGGIRSVIAATLPETLLGTLCLVLALSALILSGRLGAEFAGISATMLATLGLCFLAAPYMAGIGFAAARKDDSKVILADDSPALAAQEAVA